MIEDTMKNTNENFTSKRSASIDTLRFIAAGMVCLAHSIPVADLNFIIPDFILGRIGVVVFFMISGYLIPISLNSKNGGVKGFWISRFFRLYPMYWVSIILAILFLQKSNINEILLNITMFQSFFRVKDLIGVYWTLIIEMLFYMYCSVMFFFDVLSKRTYVLTSFYIMLFVSLIFSIIKFTHNINLPIAIPLLFSVMFIGYVIKLHERKVVGKKDFIYIIISFVIVIPFVSYFGYGDETESKSIFYIISYIVGVALFIFLFKVSVTNIITPKLGEISYSTYLIHPVVMALVFTPTMNFYFNKWVLFFFYMAIVYAMSNVFFKYIEIPFINMGKKIKEKIL